MEPLATKDIGVEPELEGGEGDIESIASDEGSLGFNPDTGVPSAIEKRVAPGARRRVLVVSALIIVAIATAVGGLALAAGRSNGAFVPSGTPVYRSVDEVISKVCTETKPGSVRYRYDGVTGIDSVAFPIGAFGAPGEPRLPSADDLRRKLVDAGVDGELGGDPLNLDGNTFLVSGNQFELSIVSWETTVANHNVILSMVDACPNGEAHNPNTGFIFQCRGGGTVRDCAESLPQDDVAPYSETTTATGSIPLPDSTLMIPAPTTTNPEFANIDTMACTELAIRAGVPYQIANYADGPDIDDSTVISRVVCDGYWGAVFVGKPTTNIVFVRIQASHWASGLHAGIPWPATPTDLFTGPACHGIPPDVIAKLLRVEPPRPC